MLVVISDLHFTDGTTSNTDAGGKDLFNVQPGAFELFFSWIAEIVAEVNTDKKLADGSAPIKEVKFVYNGDIFDPLRSNFWFGKPVKPWDASPNANAILLADLVIILNLIIAQNRSSLAWLSGANVANWGAIWNVGPSPVTVERIYIPGNHDRVLNENVATRQIIQNALGTKANPLTPFQNFLPLTAYKTLILHGHEADPYNCEFDGGGNPIYGDPPIGDAMTTMLFARLGFDFNNASLVPGAVEKIREIDNVRPALAGVRFIQDVIRDFNIKSQVSSILDSIIDNFNLLGFYNKWYKAHNSHLSLWDDADKLQYVLAVIKQLGASVPAGKIEKISSFFAGNDDPLALYADKILKTQIGSGCDFCVMGHTHEADHVVLSSIPVPGNPTTRIEKHYLNSGTFRKTFTQTLDSQEFVSNQRMSFIVIYGPYEFDGVNVAPVYEMWNGTRQRN